MSRHRYRIPIITVLVIVALLVIARLALPWAVLNQLNKQLADMGDYRGHIEDVDLALWRGAYRIDGMRIVKTTGKVPVPLLNAPHIDLGISWAALWYEHSIVARVAFEKPVLTFVDGGQNGPDQTGTGTDWREPLQNLVPITLNEVRIHDGQVVFRNFTSQPPVDVRATNVNARVTNLTNATNDTSGARVAHFTGTANILGQAPLDTGANFDPFNSQGDFDFHLRVTHIELTRLNDLAKAYGRFNFAGGDGDLVMEAHARDGQLSGYIKPLFRKVDIFDWKQDVSGKDGGVINGLWQALVAGAQNLFKNQSADQFGTRVTLSGDLRHKEIGTWGALTGILRNAFVKALQPRYDHHQND